MWCSYNERTNRLCINRSLLTNRLKGKAAELCLANITARITEYNRVTTTKYMSTLIASSTCTRPALLYLSCGVGKVLM